MRQAPRRAARTYRFEPAVGCVVIARGSGVSSVFKFSDQPAKLMGAILQLGPSPAGFAVLAGV
jgi:hypothetical protein